MFLLERERKRLCVVVVVNPFVKMNSKLPGECKRDLIIEREKVELEPGSSSIHLLPINHYLLGACFR